MYCCPEECCFRNPVGCADIGCCDPVCCPPPRIIPKRRKPPCEEIICDPCKLMAVCDFGMDSCCGARRSSFGCGPISCGYTCKPPQSSSTSNCSKPSPCCEPEPCCNSDPMTEIYRCCEPMSSSYAGHIPGFKFHSNGRTHGKATWGTKQYMNKCLYYNTFKKL